MKQLVAAISISTILGIAALAATGPKDVASAVLSGVQQLNCREGLERIVALPADIRLALLRLATNLYLRGTNGDHLVVDDGGLLAESKERYVVSSAGLERVGRIVNTSAGPPATAFSTEGEGFACRSYVPSPAHCTDLRKIFWSLSRSDRHRLVDGTDTVLMEPLTPNKIRALAFRGNAVDDYILTDGYLEEPSPGHGYRYRVGQGLSIDSVNGRQIVRCGRDHGIYV